MFKEIYKFNESNKIGHYQRYSLTELSAFTDKETVLKYIQQIKQNPEKYYVSNVAKYRFGGQFWNDLIVVEKYSLDEFVEKYG